MPTFDVHSYSIVRIKVIGIEAENAEAAIAILKSEDSIKLEASRLIEKYRPGQKIEAIELDDGSPAVSYLVDTVGDEEFNLTQRFDVAKDGSLVRITSESLLLPEPTAPPTK